MAAFPPTLPTRLLAAADWLQPGDLADARIADSRGILVERNSRLAHFDAVDRLSPPCIVGRNTSFDGSMLPAWCVIGRYCTLEDSVDVGVDCEDPRGFAVLPSAPCPGEPSITAIGCDVWIGIRSVVARGSRIGHGAIIAPHTLVAGEVPPYAVVEGNPARITRYRFSTKVIGRLLASAWWMLPPDRVAGFAGRAVEEVLDIIDGDRQAELRTPQ